MGAIAFFLLSLSLFFSMGRAPLRAQGVPVPAAPEGASRAEAVVAETAPAAGLILTLERAWELAEQNSVALQKRALDLDLDRVKAKSLWAQVFPSINISGGANYTIPLNSNVKETDPSYTARLSLSLGLSAGLPYTLANISLAYKNGLLNYEQARRQLRFQTSKTFYSLLAQKDSLLVLEGSTRLAEEQLVRDRAARQNGYLGEVDFLSSSLSAERAKLSYTRALSEYRSALGDFLAVLGLDRAGGTAGNAVLEGEVEISPLKLDPEALIAARLPQRPSLAVQRNEVERLKNARMESFLSAKAPSLNFSASLGASLAKGLDDTASAGVSVSIPIDPWIPRSQKDQAVRRAQGEYEKALLDLRDMEDSARREIRSYVENTANAWREVEIARLQVSYAQRSFELAEQGYRMGTMNFLNFETVRNRLTEARQQRLQSELNYQVLILDLAASLDMDEAELRRFSE
ncbi:MAG: TolC family protein [Treponema sp.]|jgi:outer membrane protein TolC|nr:TolC family protein [Treponema sp.]